MSTKLFFSLIVSVVLISASGFASSDDAITGPLKAFEKISHVPSGETIPESDARLRLLDENQEAWYTRWKAVSDARKTLDITYFSIYDDLFGKAFLGLLLKKADQGVRVRMILDAKGTYYFSNRGDDYLEELVANKNVSIVIFNSVLKALSSLPKGIRKFLAVNHDKMIIVDGEKVITGGRNIGEAYFVSTEDVEDAWKDTDIIAGGKDFASEVTDAFDREFRHKTNWKITPDWFFNLSSKRKKLVYAAEALEHWMSGYGEVQGSRLSGTWEEEILRWYTEQMREFANARRSSGLPEVTLEIDSMNSDEYYELPSMSNQRNQTQMNDGMNMYELAQYYEENGHIDLTPEEEDEKAVMEALQYLHSEGLIPARGRRFWNSIPFFKPDTPDMYNSIIRGYSQLVNYNPHFDVFRDSLVGEIKVIDSQGASANGRINEITPNIVKLIDSCEEELIIQNPYVVLTDEAWQSLARANKRGVKIIIHTNSPVSTDSMLTQAFFVEDARKIVKEMENLRIFAFVGKRKMHAKTFVFDRKVCAVGTYNLDPISQEQNSEVVSVIRAPEFARYLHSSIMRDIKESREFKMNDPKSDEYFGPETISPKKTMRIINFLRKLKFLRNVI